MVRSILNTNINYIENKTVEPEDMKHEASIYELAFNNKDIVIGIGKEKYKYIDNNVIYFPIYLIVAETVQDQIGVFEVDSEKLPYLLDDDGDVDLEKLGDPLFYSFVNDKYLESFSDVASKDDDEDDDQDDSNASNVNKDDHEDDDDDDGDDDDEGDDDDGDGDGDGDDKKSDTNENLEIFEKVEDVAIDMLTEQTKEDAEREKIKVPVKSLWIQKYLKSLQYDIVDNEGGGDCMFAAVRDAFAFIGKTTSVARLRNILVTEVNENPSIFENYKQHYEMYNEAVKNDEKEMKKMIVDDKALKERLGKETSGGVKTAIVEQRKEIADIFARLKQERKASKQLQNEYRC